MFPTAVSHLIMVNRRPRCFYIELHLAMWFFTSLVVSLLGLNSRTSLIEDAGWMKRAEWICPLNIGFMSPNRSKWHFTRSKACLWSTMSTGDFSSSKWGTVSIGSYFCLPSQNSWYIHKSSTVVEIVPMKHALDVLSIFDNIGRPSFPHEILVVRFPGSEKSCQNVHRRLEVPLILPWY